MVNEIFPFLPACHKTHFFKRKTAKKKATKPAAAHEPKGNGIMEGGLGEVVRYAVVFWPLLQQTPMGSRYVSVLFCRFLKKYPLQEWKRNLI